jgi:hypothetical protein
VILHASEDVGEILQGIDAARLARRDERVEAREALSALDIVDEEVVLSAKGDAAERALRAIVVERHVLIMKEDAELLPLVVRVANRCSDRTLARMSLALRIEPPAHAPADWPRALFPKVQLGGADQALRA